MENNNLLSDYESLKTGIQGSLQQMSREFIAIGFYLKRIRDEELFKQDEYTSIWEFAQDTYNIAKSTCSRWMSMNDKFSKDGNSPFLDDEYKDFGKSQLQEMLYLTDEQIEQAKPDMSTKEIREIRKAESESEILSAYGTKIDPDEGHIGVKGCEGGHACFCCHVGCAIRQEECYCVEAPMGNPFSCTTLQQVDDLRNNIGNKCQFVNLDSAYHRTGDNEPVPCCKECDQICSYACCKAVNNSKEEEAKQEEHPITWFVTEYCESSSHLSKMIEICTKNDANAVKAKAIQELLSPNGYIGGNNSGGMFYDFYRYDKGIRFRIGSQEITMSYIQFVRTFEDVYGPFNNQDEEDQEDSVAMAQQGKKCSYDKSKECDIEETMDKYFTKAGNIIGCAGCCRCCLKRESCPHECDSSAEARAENSVDDPESEVNIPENEIFIPEEPEEMPEAEYREVAEEYTVEYFLEEQSRRLGEMIALDDYPAKPLARQQILVKALTALVAADAEQEDIPEPVQPELPKLKNNEQRKEWLRNYRNWGVWYTDERIGVTYYKYDFEDGTRLITEEYQSQYQDYSSHFHLVGGPAERPENQRGCSKYPYHEFYSRYPDSETEIVEFLKYFQKGR